MNRRRSDPEHLSTAFSTIDHKPTHEDEKARILKAGGLLSPGSVGGGVPARVFPGKDSRMGLSVSRGFGDEKFKRPADFPPEDQIVSCVPEVFEYELSSGDEYLILATDGIWDQVSNRDFADFMGELSESIQESACSICNLASERASLDDMTILVVDLREHNNL